MSADTHSQTTRTELGSERQCTKCLNFWPDDSDFFGPCRRYGRLHTQCRACKTDWYRAHRSKQALPSKATATEQLRHSTQVALQALTVGLHAR